MFLWVERAAFAGYMPPLALRSAMKTFDHLQVLFDQLQVLFDHLQMLFDYLQVLFDHLQMLFDQIQELSTLGGA